MAASSISRNVGLGAGAIIGGRVTMALAPSALAGLAAGRQVVLVTGTNGKTTTAHLLAAALRTVGPVAHNATGANMPDGAVAALMADPAAPVAVLEVDELHLADVADAVAPAVIVVLNLTRDQLDRGSEVRSVAAAVSAALAAHPDTVVVANADDPMVVWAVGATARVVWVAAGSRWTGDANACPRCGGTVHRDRGGGAWRCGCGLTRPVPDWTAGSASTVTGGRVIALPLRLPGSFNVGNAAVATATATALGLDPDVAAAAMSTTSEVAGRYAMTTLHGRRARMLLAKNPAGWAETLHLLGEHPVLLAVNAREADGRDSSWLWDVPFENLVSRHVVASGERAADLGVRLTYAGIDHTTVPDPIAALDALPPGPVDVAANYTAFHRIRRRIDTERGSAE
ncbi:MULTISPECIES: Mur ligase family protein [unclassified Pseudonocardia]|uniref:Mur ligase family protein n=1 Tax=unclassified Pseudonocardia TaxID=2619320 RepID=UPI0025D626FF|nr:MULTISPECIES: Mur ligase family protein [unclassified Pseudonocardia]